MERRRKLKKKDPMNEKEEMELKQLEEKIAGICEQANRKRVNDNFKDIGGKDGNLCHQGIWSIKKKYFPKIALPTGWKTESQEAVDYQPCKIERALPPNFQIQAETQAPSTRI